MCRARLTDVEHHDADNQEVNQERARSAFGESTAGTDEETGSNRASDGNHVKMPGLHGAIQLDEAFAIVSLLERLEIQTVAGEPVIRADGAILMAVLLGRG